MLAIFMVSVSPLAMGVVVPRDAEKAYGSFLYPWNQDRHEQFAAVACTGPERSAKFHRPLEFLGGHESPTGGSRSIGAPRRDASVSNPQEPRGHCPGIFRARSR